MRVEVRCFMLATSTDMRDGQLYIYGAPTSELYWSPMPDPDASVDVAYALEIRDFQGDLAYGIALVDSAGNGLRHDRFLDTVSPPDPAGMPRTIRGTRTLPLDAISEPGIYRLVLQVEGAIVTELPFVVSLS